MGKLLKVGVLAHQGLGGLHAHDALIEGAGDAGVDLAHLALGFEDVLLKPGGDDRQYRHHGDDHQGQLPVDDQHGDGHRDQEDDRPDQVHQAPAKGLGQVAGIRGQPAHQVAHAGAVVVGKGQLLQFAKAFHAHVVVDMVLHPGRHQDKQKDRAHLRQDDAQVGQAEGPQGGGQALRGDVVIDRVAGHQRQNDVCDGQHRHHGRHKAHLLPVAAHVQEQLFEQPRVELPGVVLFFNMGKITHGLPPGCRCAPGKGIRPPSRTGCGECAGTGRAG